MKILPKTLIFVCQRGTILPNMVTLGWNIQKPAIEMRWSGIPPPTGLSEYFSFIVSMYLGTKVVVVGTG